MTCYIYSRIDFYADRCLAIWLYSPQKPSNRNIILWNTYFNLIYRHQHIEKKIRERNSNNILMLREYSPNVCLFNIIQNRLSISRIERALCANLIQYLPLNLHTLKSFIIVIINNNIMHTYYQALYWDSNESSPPAAILPQIPIPTLTPKPSNIKLIVYEKCFFSRKM